MTYLTPENLGVVNKPYAPISGTREITGSLSCYLKTGGTNDAGDLLNELLNSTTATQNAYEITFRAGGASAPYVEINSQEAMLSIPTVDVQDVISLNLDFKLLPSALATAIVVTGALVQGTTYEIQSVGTTTPAQFVTIGATQAAGTALTIGRRYIIHTVGDADFTTVGATSNSQNTQFVATGTSAGGTTGVALEVYFVKNSSSGTGTGTVASRSVSLDTSSPNEFQIRYYPSATASTTTDTNDTD